jgi:MoxR-like ATPase
VDEIDKADPSVPNGLLEALANDGFEVLMPSVKVRRGKNVGPPLVVITTNEERELPSAFLRRCLVHEMSFPFGKGEATAFLHRRARVHHSMQAVSDKVLDKVIDMLLGDRVEAENAGGHRPGPAEFLDILRALVEFGDGLGVAASPDERVEVQLQALDKIRGFAFKKYLQARDEP